LTSNDLKVAIKAAKELIKKGRKSARPLIKVLDRDDETRLTNRALAVLYNINWKKVGLKTKKLAVAKMFPLLIKFEPNGRSIESFFAEATMLKIGTPAMPAFIALVRSDYIILSKLGLSALSEVKWSRISPKAAFEVKSALSGLTKIRPGPFVMMAREIIREINKVYRRAENELEDPVNVISLDEWKLRKNMLSSLNSKPETVNDQQNAILEVA
jgi:hypothetical protein